MLAVREFRLLPSILRRFHVDHSKRAKKFPNPWDLMTGIELWEATQYARGNTDPFFMNPRKRGVGTKDCPNVIPSMYDKRMVGCVCHPDATKVVFWWLHENCPRRCNCNYWFVLEVLDRPKFYEE